MKITLTFNLVNEMRAVNKKYKDYGRNGRKIRNKETGLIFINIYAATAWRNRIHNGRRYIPYCKEKEHKTNKPDIEAVCKGERGSAGMYNGISLTWEYID